MGKGDNRIKKINMEKYIVMLEREHPLEHKELARFETLAQCKEFRKLLNRHEYTYAYLVHVPMVLNWRSKD